MDYKTSLVFWAVWISELCMRDCKPSICWIPQTYLSAELFSHKHHSGFLYCGTQFWKCGYVGNLCPAALKFFSSLKDFNICHLVFLGVLLWSFFPPGKCPLTHQIQVQMSICTPVMAIITFILSLSLYFCVKKATCQEAISFFTTECLLLQWCLDNSRYSRGNEKVEIDIPLWLHWRHWKLTGLQTESGQKINTSIWASFPIGKVKGSGLRNNLEYQNFACAALWVSNPIFKNLSKGDTQTNT